MKFSCVSINFCQSFKFLGRIWTVIQKSFRILFHCVYDLSMGTGGILGKGSFFQIFQIGNGPDSTIVLVRSTVRGASNIGIIISISSDVFPLNYKVTNWLTWDLVPNKSKFYKRFFLKETKKWLCNTIVGFWKNGLVHLKLSFQKTQNSIRNFFLNFFR